MYDLFDVRDGQGRELHDLTAADDDDADSDDGKGKKGKGKGKGRKKKKRLRGTKALLSARYGLRPLNGGWVWCEVGRVG